MFQELLFRGALLPLVGVDWRGVAASGLVFGILHISGGRNVAFATWYTPIILTFIVFHHLKIQAVSI